MADSARSGGGEQAVRSKTRTPRHIAATNHGTIFYIMVKRAIVVAIVAAACIEEPTRQRPEPCDRHSCVDLPIAAADTAFNAYGVWPFGVHGSSHAADGHPGWDIEFKAGAFARAVASGVVQALVVDTASGTTTVQLM